VTEEVCEKLNIPPIEHSLAPFLGLTVQACGEPCGPAAGFDFLTLEVIQILYIISLVACMRASVEVLKPRSPCKNTAAATEEESREEQ
jgi:hypothetical protein